MLRSLPYVRSIAAATLLAILAGGAAAPAKQIEGVDFEPQVQVGGEVLDLNGYALLRYKVVFKAYVAALYLRSSLEPEKVLSDTPKRLEIEYFWGISADDFAKATIDGIAANLPPDKVEGLRDEIREFNTFYADVKPGDRYALTYVPDIGTELALNGTPRGIVAGDDFAAAIFSIWLGESPLDSGLKAALLGK